MQLRSLSVVANGMTGLQVVLLRRTLISVMKYSESGGGDSTGGLRIKFLSYNCVGSHWIIVLVSFNLGYRVWPQF
jgi:hypothetical protein